MLGWVQTKRDQRRLGAALNTGTALDVRLSAAVANAARRCFRSAVASGVNHSTIEPLEQRQLMSGVALNVAISYVAGGQQLQVYGSNGNDQIGITQTSAGITVSNTGGWTSAYSGGFASIVVRGNAGDDKIVVDASVQTDTILFGGQGNDTLVGGSGNDRLYGMTGNNSLSGGIGRDTLVSIGGGTMETLSGGAGLDSFWLDSATTEIVTDANANELAAGAIHRVATYLALPGKVSNSGNQNVPLSAFAALPEPAVTDSTKISYKDFSVDPLFSNAGPSADDVKQGQVGDCYFLATISSIAKVDPQKIRQSIVDLGDGTYAVQFTRNGANVFVRVDGSLPVYANGTLAYAKLGSQSSTWVALMEKAFAFFRTSAATYSGIGSGWMSEVYGDLGVTNQSIYSATDAASLLATMQAELAAGDSVTMAVQNVASGAPLIASHAYMVDHVNLDPVTNQPISVVLRNPWGLDGAGNDGRNDGYVTLTPAQAYASFWAMMWAKV